ncbi:helix-turn-helix transcriptional regulator [Mammaliicoccus sciuri]|uniref:helix-turn-helix domain-containing protein n=1 Tax=Mammaliicoccus sciuri TaxID=1296 RepID=UPI003364EF06
MNIGDNLKKIRKERKINQTDFAKSLDISQSYLSDLENGRKNISMNTVQKIAEKLNVSVGYLTSGNKMYSDLTKDEVAQQMMKMNKILKSDNQNKETNLKNNLLELIQKDLSYLEVHYLNNVYNFYELEKNQNDNLLFISVLIQQLNQHKGSKDKKVYDDIIKEFDDFLKKYLNIK